jgi:hypothetical protein
MPWNPAFYHRSGCHIKKGRIEIRHPGSIGPEMKMPAFYRLGQIEISRCAGLRDGIDLPLKDVTRRIGQLRVKVLAEKRGIGPGKDIGLEPDRLAGVIDLLIELYMDLFLGITIGVNVHHRIQFLRMHKQRKHTEQYRDQRNKYKG